MDDRLGDLVAGNRRLRDGTSAHCDDRVHPRERFLGVHTPRIAVLSIDLEPTDTPTT